MSTVTAVLKYDTIQAENVGIHKIAILPKNSSIKGRKNF